MSQALEPDWIFPLLNGNSPSAVPDTVLIHLLHRWAPYQAKFPQPYTYVLPTHSFIEHPDNNPFLGMVRQFLHFKQGELGFTHFISCPEVFQLGSRAKANIETLFKRLFFLNTFLETKRCVCVVVKESMCLKNQ